MTSRDEAGTGVIPARGKILIRRPETEETLPGGTIIIPEKARESLSANQFLVISVGDAAECFWPEECNRLAHHFVTLKLCVHPIDERIIPGAWVVCRPRSLVDAGEGLFLVTQDDVIAVFSQSESTSASIRLRDSGEAVA